MKALVLLTTTLFLFTACSGKKETAAPSTVSNPNNKSGGDMTGGSNNQSPVPTTQDCYGDGVPPGQTSYYNLPSIVVHGKDSGVVAWSSATDFRLQESGQQDTFITDSRLNIRVLAHPSPGKGNDTYGDYCDQMAVDYKKLQMKIGIRKAGSAIYSDQYVFDNIPVGGCSVVHEFNPPPSNEPLVIEVMNVKWDYSCTQYQQQGFTPEQSGQVDSVCPFDLVWRKDCVEFSLQVSNDFSEDIPH